MSDCDYTLDDSLAFLTGLPDDTLADGILKGLRDYRRMVRAGYRYRRTEAQAHLRYRGYLAMARRLGDPYAVPARLPFEAKIRNRMRTLTIEAFLTRESKRAAMAARVAQLESAHG